MFNRLARAALRIGAPLALAWMAHGAAHAGLVTGSWDPPFGSFLPNLSYQARAELDVNNACSNQADGVYSTASGACFGASVRAVWLRLFHTGLADPNDFFTVVGGPPPTPVLSTYFALCETIVLPDSRCGSGNGSYFAGISSIRILQGQVAGFATNSGPNLQTLVVSGGNYYSFPDAAEANLFSLSFSVNGPDFFCTNCRSTFTPGTPTPPSPGTGGNIAADKTNLRQFLVTYLSNDTSVPKFTDSQGNAIGVRLDGAGNVLLIPEPAAPALVLTALALAGFAGRRRASATA